MSQQIKQHNIISLESELKQSYLEYAMSVIVGRALPDVRDGLKPVHRRVLYAMEELNNYYNKPYKKSARIVGDVIGKYHPHSDTAVYDAIVRLAQKFSMRYILVDGQGNFGSVDGDAPAAMRYTEIRMSQLSHSLLADLDKDTVNFIPNYDNTETYPDVLPTRVPNLLINGSSGIAVGMATNIPPHNIGEVIDACLALIDYPEINIEDLINFVTGPDFPTGGIINGKSGIRNAYLTGRGKIKIKAKTKIEDFANDKQAIIIDELPYQVNKARLIEKIALLVREKKIESISAIRDESDKDGMRVVIEVKKSANAEVLLNQLYKLTQLQVSFGINMVAINKNQPECMNLKQILQYFVQHRKEVVTRRTVFELAKARKRAHILEGLALSLIHINEIIELIKKAKNPAEAKDQLMEKTWPANELALMLPKDIDLCRPINLDKQFGIKDDGYFLSNEQAQAILDLKLHKLTGLEREKIIDEYKNLIDEIIRLLEILSNHEKLMEVIKSELIEIKEKFNDERKTLIVAESNFSDEDFIPNETVLVTVSNIGYAKLQHIDTYQAQHRGGKGKSSTTMKESDYVEHFTVANMHDTLLFFTCKGKVYWLKTYQLPLASRSAKGRPTINFMSLDKDESITSVLPVSKFNEEHQIIMATEFGIIKKVRLDLFAKPRANGVIAIDLLENDKLIAVDLTNGSQEIMLFSNAGKVIRFNESQVRSMGRTARGVRGIKLGKNQKLVSLIVIENDLPILSATENGYGKRTNLDQHRITARGSSGVIAVQTTERNGSLVDAIQVDDNAEMLLISNQGTIIRIRANNVALVSRNTQGVKLINVAENEKLISLKVVPEVEKAGASTIEDRELADG
jgi:DNA gyrase subunit A